MFLAQTKTKNHKCIIFRSSRSQMLFKVSVLKIFANFTGKHLRWSLFLIKSRDGRSATLLKRDPSTGVFLWNLRNFQNTFFYRTPPVAASALLTLLLKKSPGLFLQPNSVAWWYIDSIKGYKVHFSRNA